MSRSKLIALCALSSAFALVCLMVGAYIPDMDLSGLFMASLCMMIPLSKESKMGGLLTYGATSVLSFFVTGMRLQVVIPFVMFFGLHPLVNYFIQEKKFNKIIFFIIKLVWFIGTLYLMYYVLNSFLGLSDKIVKIINIVIPVIGVIFFVFYDFCMMKFQRMINVIIRRFKL